MNHVPQLLDRNTLQTHLWACDCSISGVKRRPLHFSTWDRRAVAKPQTLRSWALSQGIISVGWECCARKTPRDWKKKAEPVILKHCWSCHSITLYKRKRKTRLLSGFDTAYFLSLRNPPITHKCALLGPEILLDFSHWLSVIWWLNLPLKRWNSCVWMRPNYVWSPQQSAFLMRAQRFIFVTFSPNSELFRINY